MDCKEALEYLADDANWDHDEECGDKLIRPGGGMRQVGIILYSRNLSVKYFAEEILEGLS